MSFFDDAEDEPQPDPRSERRRPRASARTPRERGRGGGPPHAGQPNVQNRRLIAIGVIVVVVIVLALVIRGCEANKTTNALKSYSNDVSVLISNSDLNGAKVFLTLADDKGATLTNHLDSELTTARNQLTQAQNLSVPSQMTAAQENLIMVMTQRRDGIHQLAQNIQAALSKDTSSAGVSALAVGTSLLYASDVVYKNYVTHQIAMALHGDDISICPPGTGASTGTCEVTINSGQIVPRLDWLQPSYIASHLGTGSGTGTGNPTGDLSTSSANGHQSGLHGDSINAAETKVNGETTLSTTATTTVAQNGQAPSFELSVTDEGGYSQQPNCTVSVAGITGKGETGVIASQGTGTCTVKLPKVVPPGTYTVTADVWKVWGEHDLSNNRATYSVTFEK